MSRTVLKHPRPQLTFEALRALLVPKKLRLLRAGDSLDLKVQTRDWSVTLHAREDIRFEDSVDMIQHLLDHPDQWTGDVFQIVALVEGLQP